MPKENTNVGKDDTSVAWVSNDTVWTGGNELVVVSNAHFKGEEAAEGGIAGMADGAAERSAKCPEEEQLGRLQPS